MAEDKFELNKLCLKSFVEAFKHIQPEVVFLADFCGAREEEMIQQVVPFKYSFIPTNIGINETCLLQYEMANKTEHDIILFQECDYLYRPETGKTVLEGIQSLGLVSPYDNLNFYLDPSIHSEDVKLKLVGDQHWRSVERVTMTFGIKSIIFKENYETFKKYGYLDNDVWHTLRANGHQMWTPIPSLATHMVKDFMAPGIKWEELWK
ncbi:MAG: hypothetical protein M0P59_13390 [Gallionella sp.]|nr:hypothetical protein [Gallionella sp.]